MIHATTFRTKNLTIVMGTESVMNGQAITISVAMTNGQWTKKNYMVCTTGIAYDIIRYLEHEPEPGNAIDHLLNGRMSQLLTLVYRRTQ